MRAADLRSAQFRGISFQAVSDLLGAKVMCEPDDGCPDEQPKPTPSLARPTKGNLDIGHKVMSGLQAIGVSPEAATKLDDVTHGRPPDGDGRPFA